ncbi:unnamed protein product [Mucor fragilis]
MVDTNEGLDVIMERTLGQGEEADETIGMMIVEVEKVVNMMNTAVKTKARLCPFLFGIWISSEAIYTKQANKLLLS